MTTPLISIIVPVYNVEPYLRCCLDSLIGQTLREIEIICVDDGSTDGSSSILADYAARDERVRVITQSNVGQGVARNRALDVARAPYTMFCDSDDWFEPDMCEKMHSALEAHPQASVAICNQYIEWERSKEADEPEFWQDEIPFSGFHEMSQQVIRECLVGPPYKIYRRELIEREHIRFPEGIRYEDFYFWYVLAAHIKGVVFIPDKLYHYRQRAGSTMHNSFCRTLSQNVDYIRIASLLWAYFKNNRFENLWDGYIADRWADLVKSALRYSPDAESRKQIVDQIRNFVINECKENDGVASNLLLKALLISMDIPAVRESYLGGIFQIRYSLSQIIYRFCGIPVYRMKRREKIYTRYILGIPISKIIVEEKDNRIRRFQTLLFKAYLPKISTFYALPLDVDTFRIL